MLSLPRPDGSGYDISPEEFAHSLAALADLGGAGVRWLLRHHAGVHRSAAAGTGGPDGAPGPQSSPSRRVQRNSGSSHRPGAGHRRADQPHGQEADEGGPAPGGRGLYAGPGPGPDGGQGGHPGCERGPAGDRRGGYDGPHSEGSPGGDGRPPPAGLHRPEGAGAGPAGLLRQGHRQLGQRGGGEPVHHPAPCEKVRRGSGGPDSGPGGYPQKRAGPGGGGPPHPGAGAGPGRPPGGCVHRLPDTHRLRRAGGGCPDPDRPAPGEGGTGAKDRAGGVQHLLRPA